MLGKFNLCCSCGMCRIPKYDRLAFKQETRRLPDENERERLADLKEEGLLTEGDASSPSGISSWSNYL